MAPRQSVPYTHLDYYSAAVKFSATTIILTLRFLVDLSQLSISGERTESVHATYCTDNCSRTTVELDLVTCSTSTSTWKMQAHWPCVSLRLSYTALTQFLLLYNNSST